MQSIATVADVADAAIWSCQPPGHPGPPDTIIYNVGIDLYDDTPNCIHEIFR